MKRAVCAFFVLAWLLTGGVGRTQAAQGELVDRVLAVVSGDVIMLSDVQAAIELGFVDPGGATDPTRAVLSELIDRALVLDEVDRYAPPEPTVQAVSDRIAIVRARFRTVAALESLLLRVGMDQRQLEDAARQDLRIRAYLAQRFAADTPEASRDAIAEWTSGLRRRADIVDLYTPAVR